MQAASSAQGGNYEAHNMYFIDIMSGLYITYLFKRIRPLAFHSIFNMQENRKPQFNIEYSALKVTENLECSTFLLALKDCAKT
jgi:hypothetical protein